MDNSAKTEKILRGIPASPGISIGPAFIFQEHTLEPELRMVSRENIPEEIKKFKEAIRESREYLEKIYQETDKKYGKDFAEIVQIQISLLEDKIFLNEVVQMIEEKKINADYATFRVFQSKKEHFLRLSDEYFRERAFDIQNLKRLIIRKLLGEKLEVHFKDRSIIVADNINPADIIRFHHQNILGFCTNVGGKNSHTAIVARSLGVPAVVGAEFITRFVNEGDELILDGNEGIILVNPAPEQVQIYTEKQNKFLILEQDLLKDAGKPAITRDGRTIQVMGNIEFVEELPQLLKSGAEGIGLYRTEGLFLSGSHLPTEEQQTQTYLRIAEAAFPREVLVRTLDVGGDKILPDVVHLPEDNPFLGWRAIRFTMDHREIFIPQLKAIIRANRFHNIKLLLPMVSSVEEVRQVKALFSEVTRILEKEGKEFFSDIPVGIMVEIPSAAIMIEDFMGDVDFFSIGTNDLVQYTLAVDRTNEKISHLYNHFHPAHLYLIRKVIEAGKKHGKMVSMCGEMAGDPVAVPLLIGMGLENFSAAHFMLPEIKNVIRNISAKDCLALARTIENMKTTLEIQEICENYYAEIFTIARHTLNQKNSAKGV